MSTVRGYRDSDDPMYTHAASLPAAPVEARSLWAHDLGGPTETIHDKREAFGEDEEWTEFRAVEAVVPSDEQRLNAAYDAIEQVLLHHRLSGLVCADDEDSNFPLVDHLCTPGAKDIGGGHHEIRLICDAIYGDETFRAALSPPAVLVEPAGIAALRADLADALRKNRTLVMALERSITPETSSVVKAAPTAPLAEVAKALIDELVMTAEFSLNQGEHGAVRAAYILNWVSKFRTALSEPADHQGEQR